MFKELNQRLESILKATNGKKIIIWGWGMTGQFMKMYLEGKNKKISCVIDDGVQVREGELRTHHSLQYYKPESAIILVTPNKELDEIRAVAKEYGFQEKDLIFVRKVIYQEKSSNILEYYNWLEYKYDLDLRMGKSMEQSGYGEKYSGRKEYHNYWPAKGITLENALKGFYFDDTDAVFDFGCGKGAALFMFYRCGVKKLGGIEFDEEVFQCALENMQKMNLDVNLYCGDASAYTEIDEYNYFYMYDPFVGEVFSKVISNIEESFERRPRKIVLIYASPQCHNLVVKNNKFHMVEEVENIFVDTRTTNIYVMDI